MQSRATSRPPRVKRPEDELETFYGDVRDPLHYRSQYSQSKLLDETMASRSALIRPCPPGYELF